MDMVVSAAYIDGYSCQCQLGGGLEFASVSERHCVLLTPGDTWFSV